MLVLDLATPRLPSPSTSSPRAGGEGAGSEEGLWGSRGMAGDGEGSQPGLPFFWGPLLPCPLTLLFSFLLPHRAASL